MREPGAVVAADVDHQVAGAKLIGSNEPFGRVLEVLDQRRRRPRDVRVVGEHAFLRDRVVDLHDGAVPTKSDAKRIVGLAPIGQTRRDQAIAMRLIAQIKEQADVLPATATALQVHRRDAPLFELGLFGGPAEFLDTHQLIAPGVPGPPVLFVAIIMEYIKRRRPVGTDHFGKALRQALYFPVAPHEPDLVAFDLITVVQLFEASENPEDFAYGRMCLLPLWS